MTVAPAENSKQPICSGNCLEAGGALCARVEGGCTKPGEEQGLPQLWWAEPEGSGCRQPRATSDSPGEGKGPVRDPQAALWWVRGQLLTPGDWDWHFPEDEDAGSCKDDLLRAVAMILIFQSCSNPWQHDNMNWHKVLFQSQIFSDVCSVLHHGQSLKKDRCKVALEMCSGALTRLCPLVPFWLLS